MKRALVLLMLAGMSLAGKPAFAAEPLGRFFFTPAQRAQLDTARTQKNRAALSGGKSEDAAPAPEVLTYGGAVRRSDGKSTVWLNNHAINDRAATGGVVVGRVRPNGTVTLQVPQTDRNVDLKVGQSVEILSGTIEEPYSRRITAPKPAPKPAPPEAASPEAKPGSGKAAGAPANAPTTVGKDALESKVQSALERLRSMRKEQDDNDQDRRTSN